jgi:ceramide glucosyltransferase
MMPFLPSVAQGVSACGALYDLCAAFALRHWLGEAAPHFEGPLEPVSYFRPVKRGVPGLRDKLEMLVASTLPADQIILGVDPASEEEAIAESVRLAHPGRAIAVVRCLEGRAINPKISKLIQMEPVAVHGAWCLSDSEVLFSAEFLTAFRHEWQACGAAALTAGYRFTHLESWPQRCDALGVLLGLWPGLALIRLFSRPNFTLGACTLFRRAALAAIGGWSAFGADLGEDQRVGAALVRAGHAVRLSRHVVTLDSDPISWRDYWRHQRRVAVTYRAGNPAGYLGLLVTFGPVWSFLGFLVCPQPGPALAFLVTVIVRAWRIDRSSRWLDFPVPGLLRGSLIASFVEPACWVLSWFSRRVWWSGRWWRVDRQGRLSPSR